MKTPDINRIDLDINAIAQEIGMGRLQIIFLQNEIMKLTKKIQELEGAEMDSIDGVSENKDNKPSMA